MDYDIQILNKQGEVKITGVGNWKLDNTIIVSKSGSGDYSTIAEGLAAADGVTKTLVIVEAGTYTESDLTVASNVSLAGIERGAVTLNPSTGTDVMELQGSNYVVNFEIGVVAGIGVLNTVIDITGPGVYIQDVVIAYLANTLASSIIIKAAHASLSVTMESCDISGNNVGSGTVYGYNGFASGGTTYIRGGTWLITSANGYAVNANSGHTVEFQATPRLEGTTGHITGAGTLRGAIMSGTQWIPVNTEMISYNSQYTDMGSTTQSEKFGDIFLGPDKDIYPGNAGVGLQYRFEQLFGDDKPADPYKFTQRNFTVNNFTGHEAGFEDSQTSPYSFGGSPGGFAVGVPANTSAHSNTYPHFLTLQDLSGTGVALRWLDATGKNNMVVIGAAAPLWTTSDYNFCEMRMFDTTSPGGASKYWAVRLNWMGATSPDYPLRVGLWYGTGLTYAHNNGTVVQQQVPLALDGTVHKLQATVVGPNHCYLTPFAGDGTGGVGISAGVAGWPAIIRYAIIRLDINWTMYHVDEMRMV